MGLRAVLVPAAGLPAVLHRWPVRRGAEEELAVAPNPMPPTASPSAIALNH